MLNFSEVRKNQSGMLHVNFGVIRIAKSHATPLADETAIIYFDLRFDNDVSETCVSNFRNVCCGKCPVLSFIVWSVLRTSTILSR